MAAMNGKSLYAGKTSMAAIDVTSDSRDLKISQVCISESESPFGNYPLLDIEISNVPIYNPHKPRYSIFYSYECAPNCLIMEKQFPAYDCSAFMPMNDENRFINKHCTSFYISLPWLERGVYLTIVDVIAGETVLREFLTKDQIEGFVEDSTLGALLEYPPFQEDLMYVKQGHSLKIESCKRLSIDGVFKDFYSVSFACNNSYDKENFEIRLTKNIPEKGHDYFSNAILLNDNSNVLEENKSVKILYSYVKNRRGYIVFSVPVIDKIENPYYINVLDRTNGRFFARAETIFIDINHFKRIDFLNFEEATIFNDSSIYQRWYKQHEALPVELAKQRKVVFKKATKFSVVITVNNENVKFLEETLQSIVAQTYGNYEVILVSSVSKGSDYWSYMGSLENSVNNLRFLDFGENASCTSCYYEGGDEANGDFIVFLKGGDELTEDALFQFKKTIDEHDGDVHLLFCDEDRITSEGYARPSFNAWDPVKRLARNFNNSIFVFSKEAFEEIEDPEYDIDGAEN